VTGVDRHLMSPTAVAILLLLALVVDWMSFGPNSIRDRIAFCLALPAISEGFNGGPLDRWTVEALSSAIDRLKAAGGDSYVAGANTERVIAALVGILFIYTLGCLAPERWSNKLGPYARLAFSKGGGAVGVGGPVGGGAKRRLNWRLWLCAGLLGVLAELPGGLVGELLHTFVSILDAVAAPLPAFLFGGG
jgi:hypothetical protein